MAAIRRAATNIKDKAVRTPLVRLNWPEHSPDAENGAPEIWLKLENLQPIGSFKVRCAANAIACIEDKDALRRTGVCTASAGNFAQGLAWCCAEEGIQCTVVSPTQAPETKLREIRRRGAEVIKVCGVDGLRPASPLAPEPLAVAAGLDRHRTRLPPPAAKVPYSEWWQIIESHVCPQAPGAFFIHPGAEGAVLARGPRPEREGG